MRWLFALLLRWLDRRIDARIALADHHDVAKRVQSKLNPPTPGLEPLAREAARDIEAIATVARGGGWRGPR